MPELLRPRFSSRLLIGGDAVSSPAIMPGAIRRPAPPRHGGRCHGGNRRGKTGDAFSSLIRELDVTVLPNTAAAAACASGDHGETGARTVATSWIKLEVIADNDTLRPDFVRLVEAAGILIRTGLTYSPIAPRTSRSASAAGRRRLQGGDAVGGADRQRQGHRQPRALETPARPPARHHARGRRRLGAPATPAEAIELGYDAVLLDTAMTKAAEPVAMAKAFRLDVEAGRATLRRA